MGRGQAGRQLDNGRTLAALTYLSLQADDDKHVNCGVYRNLRNTTCVCVCVSSNDSTCVCVCVPHSSALSTAANGADIYLHRRQHLSAPILSEIATSAPTTAATTTQYRVGQPAPMANMCMCVCVGLLCVPFVVIYLKSSSSKTRSPRAQSYVGRPFQSVVVYLLARNAARCAERERINRRRTFKLSPRGMCALRPQPSPPPHTPL